MAFTFSNVSNQLVNCNSASVINNLSPFVWAGWIRCNGLGPANAGKFADKNQHTAQLGTGAVFRFSVAHGSINMLLVTSRGTVDTSGNVWDHWGFYYSGSNAATSNAIYKNGSTVPYSLQRNCSGTLSADGNSNFIIGNLASGTRPFFGQLEEVCVYNAELSTADWLLLSTSKVRGMPLQIQ